MPLHKSRKQKLRHGDDGVANAHALIICSYYVKYNTKNYVKRLKKAQEKRALWAQSYSHQREQS